MVSKDSRKGMVRFAYSPKGSAKDVMLAGDFTNWAPTKMAKQRDGLFVSVLSVPPGKHEYKFVVDGRWVADADNPHVRPNPFGTVNSLLQTE
jgi:1,4-alpha-glucan branching enzyme